MNQDDDLRRMTRHSVCCRVDVRDRFGLWTAVTEDVSDQGCRLVTAKQPRVGATLQLTLSSDLFPESLEVDARTVWVTARCVGVAFDKPAEGALTPSEWIARVVEYGRVEGAGARARGAPQIVPVVRRGRAGPRRADPDEGDAVVVPLRATRR